MSRFTVLFSKLFRSVPVQPVTQEPTWYRDEEELERLINRLRERFRNQDIRQGDRKPKL